MTAAAAAADGTPKNVKPGLGPPRAAAAAAGGAKAVRNMLPPSRRLTAARAAAAEAVATAAATGASTAAASTHQAAAGSKTKSAARTEAVEKVGNGLTASGEWHQGAAAHQQQQRQQQQLMNSSTMEGDSTVNTARANGNGLPGSALDNGVADGCGGGDGRGGSSLAVGPGPARSSRGGARRTAVGPLLRALRAQAAEQAEGEATLV